MQYIREMVPRRLKILVKSLLVVPLALRYDRLFQIYVSDLERFAKYSGVAKGSPSRANLHALITMDYHRIEKGLSLRKPRPGFGAEAVDALMTNLKKYVSSYGMDDVIRVAVKVLDEYYRFNQRNSEDLSQLNAFLMEFEEGSGADSMARGGTLRLSREDVLAAANHDLSSFFSSRHSVRDYSDEEVELSLIEKATRMAICTPSVCNRQAWRVYVFSSATKMREILSLQNGNRGFAEQINKLLVVTVDLGSFVLPGERNQGWIDGGMFSMSLVHALHSLGLGTCCLNWAVEPWQDRRLREASEIRDCESVIMMISVGHLPLEFAVAQSVRKRLDEVMTVV